MGEVFISYKREDKGRVEPLVQALRDAGLSVWWDQDIPPGAPWRATIVKHLDACQLCVVIWSSNSTTEEGRYVIEEAERAARRRAYLGLLLDGVAPPFGFTEQQALDLGAYAGRPGDPLIPVFVEQVRARLEHRTPPPMPLSPPRRPRVSGWAMAGGAAALIGVLAVAYFLLRPAPTAAAATPTAFVNQRLGQTDCTWAFISRVSEDPGGGERIRLSGVTAAPESLQLSLLQQAEAEGVPLAAVDVSEVAPAPVEVCAELQLIRPYRSDESDRMEVRLSPAPLVQTEFGWRGELEYELDFATLPPHAALIGLDSAHGMDVLIPDLHAYRRANPPARTNGTRAAYKSYFFDENQNARNVGLILMTATQPIDAALVQSIGREIGRDRMRALEQAARAGGWRFELEMVRCGLEMGPETRC
jgi:hypothetical protein